MPDLLDDDFKRYEHDYLIRTAAGEAGPQAHTNAEKYAKAIDDMKQAALDSPLDEWDYAVREAVRRDDYSAPLKFGTVRTSEALLKLYCHGMIRRMEREPTFDELERIQAWMDLAAFKQYADRLKRIMTGKVKARLEMISRILGVDGKSDMLELTDTGSEAVNAKRAEMAAIYDDMNKRHAAGSAKFYKNAQSCERFMPGMHIGHITPP